MNDKTRCGFACSMRENEKDPTQSYDKKPLHPQENKKSNVTTQNATKTSITQRLRTDLGRSVGGNDSHPTGVV